VKRNILGQKYWRKTRFSQPTYYEQELEKLVNNNIPVHAFYVEQRAEEKFHQIATRTHGRCEMLDINSRVGSDMLTDLVTEEILNNIGGQSRGKDLVTAYRKKFPKSYTSTTESNTQTDNNLSSRHRQTLTTLGSVLTKAAVDLLQTNKK
jgi:hypothetical protein